MIYRCTSTIEFHLPCCHFQSCITGPAMGPPTPACGEVDLDRDGDADQADFGIFQRCLTEDEAVFDPACLDQ